MFYFWRNNFCIFEITETIFVDSSICEQNVYTADFLFRVSRNTEKEFDKQHISSLVVLFLVPSLFCVRSMHNMNHGPHNSASAVVRSVFTILKIGMARSEMSFVLQIHQAFAIVHGFDFVYRFKSS